MVYSIRSKLYKNTIAGFMLAVGGLAAGIAQAATVSPSSLQPFGPQRVNTTSATQTITVGNEGLTTSNIVATISGTGFAIASNGCAGATLTALTPNCTITVNYRPPGISSNDTGSVSITSSSNATAHTVSLSGSSPAPTAALSTNPASNPVALTFGSQDVSTTSPAQSVTLTSTGVNDLTNVVVSVSGDFARAAAASNDCVATLPAGGNCTINVTFTPTNTGNRTGTLTVTSNSAASPTAALSGTGTPPPVPTPTLSPNTLSFGDQINSTTSTAKTVTLKNVGTTTLTINSIAIVGTNSNDFLQTTTCGSTLAGGASCPIYVQFKPQALGSRSASLSVASNATGSPTTASLSGNSVVDVPIVSLSVVQLDFGVQKVSTTSTPAQIVTLTNTGTVPMSISSIALSGSNSGDFAIAGSPTSTCNTSTGVPANGTCTVGVTFTPATGGSDNRQGTLVFTTNASNSPTAVNLVGVRVADTQTVTVASSSVSLSLSCGKLQDAGNASTFSTTTVPTGTVPTQFSYPYGFFTFRANVSGCTSPVTFTYTLPAGNTANTYLKCADTTASSCAVPSGVSQSADGRRITFTLSDDGKNGDKTAGDGFIDDPGAPAFNPPPASSPAAASSSSSGTMEWPMLLLLGLPGLLRLRRRRA